MKQKKVTKVLIALCAIGLLGCRQYAAPKSNSIPEHTRNGDHSQWRARLASFNVWGLPVLSRYKGDRMPAIGKRLAEQNLDFALIQEAWTEKGRNGIWRESGFEHKVYFKPKRTVGSGIFLLANEPLKDPSFTEFVFGGSIWKIWNGEALAGKGVGSANIDLRGLHLSLFDAHVIARQGDFTQPIDVYTAPRMMQIFETFRHVVEQADSDAFIFGVDFNMRYSHKEYEFFKKLTSLDGNFVENADTQFCTSCPENQFNEGQDNGQIDYIYLSPRLEFTHFERDFDQKFITKKGEFMDYSDHFGWVAEVKVSTKKSKHTPEQVRARTFDAIQDLRKELVKYRGSKPALKVFGIEDHFCQKCKIDDALEILQFYTAVMTDTAPPTKEALVLSSRLESYFQVFRD